MRVSRLAAEVLVLVVAAVAAAAMHGRSVRHEATQQVEPRPGRVPVDDVGIVLRHGLGPNACDKYGAREPIVVADRGAYYLFYDGLGEREAVADLAVSSDLMHWERRGPILGLGKPGENDCAAACSPWVVFAGGLWQMFYVGATKAMPPPQCEALIPYVTMRATATQLEGPWVKRPDLPGLEPKPHTWYQRSASPGHVVRVHGTYLMFFSGSSDMGGTIGIARTDDLAKPWTIDRKPILPGTEQIENASLYRDPAGRWFLFTNHVGSGGFCDALWVYWTDDIEHWYPRDKAVVLDRDNCTWSHTVLGMATVTQVGNRLAILYDGVEEPNNVHGCRDIGLAWLDLPIRVSP